MNLLKATSLAVFSLLATVSLAGASGSGPGITAEEALNRLKNGNARYASAKPQHVNESAARRMETSVNGQKPFASVLSCADSRVPVEQLFDFGVGDIFISRVAGNVALPAELGTLEYGADHLNIPLLVVLGHTKCGAVTAVFNDAKASGNLATLLEPIAPAVATAKVQYAGMDRTAQLDGAIRHNVWKAIEDVYTKSPVLRDLSKDGKLKVVGALYNIDTGRVEWLGQHPRQGELVGK